MRKWARFSPCRRYRYELGREWDESLPICVFCGLNPSTADEETDDPTIRREIGYAKAWGYGTLLKVNAYSWRSTDPKGLWVLGVEPVGEETTHTIVRAACESGVFVAAWGQNINILRAAQVQMAVRDAGVDIYALGLTKSGQPVHPLYQPKTAKPFVWRKGREEGECAAAKRLGIDRSVLYRKPTRLQLIEQSPVCPTCGAERG